MEKSKAQFNFENNPFSYRNYVAEIRYSRLDASLVGQLKGMKTPLIFKGQSLDEMKVKFRETVDSYLLECEKEGKEPEKQFATDTMISLPTELYREYVQTSEELGKNEHELILEILEEQLNVIKSEIYAEKGNMLNIYLWPDMDFYKYPLMYKGFGGFVIRREDKFVGILLDVGEEYIFEGSTEAEVIDKLNAKLTGWASYHKVSNAFFAFRRIDVFVKANLIKLCEMKHPTWSIEKIRDRYWYPDFDGQYVYALKDKSDVRVKRLADTVIIEHRKVKTNANPYLDAEYLDSRNDKREIHTVSGKYKSVWNRQGGRCYYCGKKILADHRKEIVQIDLSKGMGAGNLAYIHWQCRNSPVEYAFTDTMPICENDIIGLIESLDKKKRKKGLKFEQLYNYFQKCTKNSVSLTFKEIEEIIGEPLCKSAYTQKQYWHSTRENSISKSWLMNGYNLRRIYMDKKRIVFQRTDHKNAPVTIPEVFLNGRIPNDAKCELENYFAFIMKKYGL